MSYSAYSQQYLLPRPGTYYEQYLSKTFQPFRLYGKNNTLTKEHLDSAISKAMKKAEQEQLSRMIRYDLDHSKDVTFTEIKTAIDEFGLSSRFDEKMFEQHDLDKDKKISYEEMSIIPDHTKDQVALRFAKLKKLFSLDPNQDGKIEKSELESITQKIFSDMDTNKDGQIDRKEMISFTAKERERPLYPKTCSFGDTTFSDTMRIYGAGAYSGHKIGIQIDKSGHEARKIDVVVTDNQAPVALILGSYEPTIWNISYVRDAQISAVVVGGYHKQVISGLPKNIPVLASNKKSETGCGYFYLSKDKLKKLNPLSRHLFDRSADMFYPVNNGTVVIGQKEFDKDDLISQKVNYDSFVVKGAPLAGKAGLEDAVKKGLIRHATPQDIDSAIENLRKTEAKSDKSDLPPIAHSPNSQKTRVVGMHAPYVVLKSFTYPAGLYGGNSATFIISKGAPIPTGNPGHSRIYDMNTGKCIGALCKNH